MASEGRRAWLSEEVIETVAKVQSDDARPDRLLLSDACTLHKGKSEIPFATKYAHKLQLLFTVL
jgi:hypothetical protein